MSRHGKQTEMMRKDGYVTAAEVARAIGIELSTAHKWIHTDKMPGKRFGWNWYVDIHAFFDLAKREKMFPPDSAAEKALAELKGLVRKRATPRVAS